MVTRTPTRDVLARMGSQPVLWAAWSRVAAGSRLPGADGVSLAEFGRNLGPRLGRLSDLLRAGRYQPQPLRPLVALRGGKARIRAVPTICDRVAQRAFLDVCAPALAATAATSFSYRPGKSWLDAIARARRCRDAGLPWVLRSDIEDFFARVDHQHLADTLRQRLPDPDAAALAHAWATAPLLTDDGPVPRRRGLPEGAPVSPLLAELYLTGFDHAIHRHHGHLVRYADDLSVFCPTAEDAISALHAVETHLADLSLTINADKTFIASFDHGFALLGWHFQAATAHPVTTTEPRARQSRRVPAVGLLVTLMTELDRRARTR